jgi:hypothetical protein
VHALAWHPHVADRAYEAGGGGAAWSFDAGRTWIGANAGRDRNYTWGLAVDPDDPECWYLSASPGARYAHGSANAEAYVYRWRGSGPWERLGGGLPHPLPSMPYALTIDQGTIYAGLGNGQIHASADRGETWEPLLLTGDPLIRVLSLVSYGAG